MKYHSISQQHWYIILRSRCTLVLSATTLIVTVSALINTDFQVEAQMVVPSQAESINETSLQKTVPVHEQPATTNETVISPTVKITSPEKDQRVPIGGLTIKGTSSDSIDTDCDVLVILNGIKPYQLVTPIGPKDNVTATGAITTINPTSKEDSANEYSEWMYTLTSSYALIKEGENKITSKISCQGGEVDPSSSNIKHYSVNVTGFTTENTSSPPSLSEQNAPSNQSNSSNSYTLTNSTIIMIPVPNDLLLPSSPQTNNLDNEEADDSEDNGNDDNDHEDNAPNDGGSEDSNEKENGKAKGHGKDKG